MRKFQSIQVLRALAALGVVLFHAGQWSHLDLAVGAAGVDLFFVISGFVLWTAAEARPQTPGGFLLARLWRVAPLYWIVTLAVFAVAEAWPPALPIVHPQAAHLLLSLAFLPHTGPGEDPFPLLPTGWTLTYEVFFYALFAVALACPRDRRWQVLALGLFAASILGFGYHGWYTVLANPLLLEFLGGVWLARLLARGRLERAPRGAGFGLIGLGLSILAACQFSGLRDDFLRPFVWGPPAAMIVAGALVLELKGWGPRRALGRVLTAQGDASYSLYLAQAPLIAVFAWLTPAWPAAARMPASIAVALLGGWVCFAALERPLGLLGRRLLRAGRRPLADGRLGRGLGPAPQESLAAVDADLT